MTLELNVRVEQFVGIELEEFPALIARTAMFITDHQANMEATREFGTYYVRLPLPSGTTIHIGDALRLDWEAILPSKDCDYILGNPPYAGHVTRSVAQKADLQRLWGDQKTKWLDYVTGWFRKVLFYDASRRIRVCFVATNSIAQGEQVARLWGDLIAAGYRINFAHRTFRWANEGSGLAQVHVVIVGFSAVGPPRHCQLFDYPTPSSEPTAATVKRISPYLIEHDDTLVRGCSRPISSLMPPATYGSMPSDGGFLICDPATRPAGDKVAAKYLHRYIGARELMNGKERWIIWMPRGCPASDLRKSKFLRDRLDAVCEFRRKSRNPGTQVLATQPYRVFFNGQPSVQYIGIPAQVSALREWFTVAYLPPSVVASNTLYTAIDPDGLLFAILSSSIYMAWMQVVAGRIKSDLRFSQSICHNAFPMPETVDPTLRRKIVSAGKALISARNETPDLPLKDLYSPTAMPPNVVRAHRAIDRAVDRLFRLRTGAATQADRTKRLLDCYAAAIAKAAASGRVEFVEEDEALPSEDE